MDIGVTRPGRARCGGVVLMTVTEISILDTASQPARESGSVRAAGGEVARGSSQL